MGLFCKIVMWVIIVLANIFTVWCYLEYFKGECKAELNAFFGGLVVILPVMFTLLLASFIYKWPWINSHWYLWLLPVILIVHMVLLLVR